MGDISPNFSEWYRPPPSCMRMSSSFFFVFLKSLSCLNWRERESNQKCFLLVLASVIYLSLAKMALCFIGVTALKQKMYIVAEGLFCGYFQQKKNVVFFVCLLTT